MTWCRSEDLALDVCAPSADTPEQLQADAEIDLVAQALQEAAVEIIGLKCHKDGGTDWGEPGVDADCCCGQIVTGIVLQAEAIGQSGCYNLPDYAWKVMVTWDKEKSSVSTIAAESRRLSRRIIEVACCKIKAKGQRIPLDIERSSNSKDDGRTECPHLTLTVKA